jgi:hypothetical protein
MAATPLHVITEEIEARKDAIAKALVSGGAKDFAEYKAMCGEIRGLTHAYIYINDLVHRMENGSDD